mmetsp:Transcript_70554/g.157038  ORF Transcript_70554/g.157038 Transcript_70554/m.157038 type:complete len:84 (-) Transcript_70554:476-727(-)
MLKYVELPTASAPRRDSGRSLPGCGGGGAEHMCTTRQPSPSMLAQDARLGEPGRSRLSEKALAASERGECVPLSSSREATPEP